MLFLEVNNVSQPQPPAQPYGSPAPTVPPAYGPPPGFGQQPGYPTSPAPYPGSPAPAYPAQNFAGAPAQAGPYPTGYPAPGAGQMAMISCRLCGSVPAVDTTFRGHQGMVVVMRFLRFEGPFCRDCGLGTFRHMTSRTLVQGWYGYGSFICTPFTVLINLFRRNKVAKLAPPQPNPFGPSRPPMNPGKRLLARPMTWIGLAIPVVVLALFIFAISVGDS
jgi:hypothetical protein